MTIFSHECKPSPIESVFFLHVARLKVCCLTVIEDTDRKEEFKRILRFLFLEKEKLFKAFQFSLIDFNDFDQVFSTTGCLSCFEIQPKTAKFVKNFQVHFLHNGQRNDTFKRESLYRYL